MQAIVYLMRVIACTMAIYALAVLLACVLDEMWQFMGALFILGCGVLVAGQIRLDRAGQSSSRHEPELLSDHGADAVDSGDGVAGDGGGACYGFRCWWFRGKSTDPEEASEINVGADGAYPGGAAVAVVAGIVDVLHVDGVKKAAPGVPGVVALHDVLAAVVEVAVAEQEAEAAEASDTSGGRA